MDQHQGFVGSTARFGDRAGYQGDNTVTKTNAFAAMLYQCPGVVLMTFPSKYGVDFRNPQSDPSLEERGIVISKVLTHTYRPLAATPHGVHPIVPDQNPVDWPVDTMVAIAFPHKYHECIHWLHSEELDESGIDLTRTYLSLLWMLEGTEKAVVLGGYNFDLEGEICKYFEACVFHEVVYRQIAPMKHKFGYYPYIPVGSSSYQQQLEPYTAYKHVPQ